MEALGGENSPAFVGRSDEVGAIMAALTDADIGGAVVVGPYGAGKSAVVSEVLARLEDTEPSPYRVVRIRGSAIAARYDYGALAFLSSGLDVSLRDDPTRLRRALHAALLDGEPASRPLLVVDNATTLDGPTIELIEGMVGRREVKLLATAEGLDHGGFLRLWMEGRIRRMDLPPFDDRDSEQLLDDVLGGPVSGPLKRTLGARALGNPLLLRLMAEGQRAARTVLNRDGVWIKVRPFVHPAGIPDAAETLLLGVEPAHRETLELLSACTELPLAILERLVGGADIDVLFQRELIETLPGPPLCVRIRDRALSTLIRAGLGPGHSRVLFDRTIHAIGTRELPSASTRGIASWAIGCGGMLDPVFALRAARLANGASDPEAAFAIATAVEPPRDHPRLMLEKARALLAMGRTDEAAEASDRLARGSHAADLEQRAFQGIVHSRLCRSMPEKGAESEKALASIRAVVDGEGATPGEGGTGVPTLADELRDELLLEELDLLSFRGRYDSLAIAARRAFEAVGNGRDARLAAGAYFAEASVLTGNLEGGQALLAELSEQVRDPAVPSRVRQLVGEKVLGTSFLAGEFDRCAEVLKAREPGTGEGPDRSFDDVVQGLVFTLAHRAADAIQVLHAATQQLAHSDPEALLSVASSAHALACSLLEGAVVRVSTQGRHAGAPPPRWDTLWTASLFSALATAVAEDRRDSVPELNRLADDALAHHAVFPALIALSAAAAAGDHASVLRLQQEAQRVPGRFADSCREFCAGSLDADPHALLRAGELAAACGNQLLCHAAARAAQAAAAQRADHVRVRAARRLEHASRRRPRSHRTPAVPGAEISDFELKLMTAVADGQSSAAIGLELHLSRRTVDWHLGRLFKKLHVAGRKELAQFLPDPQPR